MTLNEYFTLSDSPMKDSATGTLMQKIVKKFPGISFDDARAKANNLLETAASKRNYHMPAVLTDEEFEERRRRVRERFDKAKLQETELV